MHRTFVATLVLCFLAAAGLPATTYVVDVTGSEPGSYTTIQAALYAAAEGDTVLVLPGTYTGDGNRDLSFGTKNLVLMSQAGPDHTFIDNQAESPHRIFNFYATTQDTTSIIDGFTIEGGRFIQAENMGAGIRCEQGPSPKFVNCVVRNNHNWGGQGGGAYVNNGSNPVFRHVTFESNIALNGGGGLYCAGTSSPILYDVTFINNESQGNGRGGGMYCGYDSNASLWNVTFAGNTTAAHGGGLAAWRSSPRMGNAVFYRNHAMGDGGAVHFDDQCTPFIMDSTFFANWADGEGGTMACVDASWPTFVRTILSYTEWDVPGRPRGSAFFCDGTSAVTVMQCCSYGNAGGDEPCGAQPDQVIYENPLFCDMPANDLTLASASPCLPGGNPWGVTIGAFGEGCSQPTVEPASWGKVKALFR